MTMGLSGTLRKHRKRMRLTQQEVANRIGVQRSTYSRYEEGTNRPSWKVLMKLADLYEITMDELVGRQTKSSAQESDDSNSSGHAMPGETAPGRSEGEGNEEWEQNAGIDFVEQEQIQRVLALFWNASRYARETALLILENGQKKID